MKRIYDPKRFAGRFPFFYGWIAVAAAAVAFFFSSPGQSYSFSIFMDHLINEFDWTRTQINTYYSLASLLSGFSMFFVGRTVDKRGSKKVILFAAMLLSAGMMWFSFVSTIPMMFIGFFIGRFAGQGTICLASGIIAPHWFVRKRGLTMMLATLGATFGNMLVPKINLFLINTYGWRNAFRIIGVAIIVIFIPIAYLFIINKPGDIGLFPDNVDDKDKQSDIYKEIELDEKTSMTRKQAMKTFSFWVLFVAAIQMSMISTGITLNYISIYKEAGIMDEGFITSMMSMGALLGTCATLVTGILINKIKKPNIVLGVLSITLACAYVILAFLDSKLMAIIYTLIIGLSMSVFGLMHGILKPYFYGRRYIGAVSGAITVAFTAGSAFGPILFGYSYDLLGGYKLLLIGCAFVSLSMALPLMLLKKPTIKSRSKITIFTN